jgi:hypothetical protein
MSSAFRKLLAALSAVLFVCSAFAHARQHKESATAELEKSAKALVTLLDKGDFQEATKDFDDTMKEKLPADKLEKTWKDLIDKAGKFKKQSSTRTQKIQEYDVVEVTCEFEDAPLIARVVFNKNKQVAGLFFRAKE